MSGYRHHVPPASRAAIAGLAAQFRERLRFDEPYFPIVQVCELTLPGCLDGFVFDVGEKEQMGAYEGRTYPASNVIQIREDVYDDALAGNGRARFTIAHELGHLLMHSEVPMTHVARPDPPRPFECSEWQADAFAGELLVFRRCFSTSESAAAIAQRFGVSVPAASCQLRAVKRGE